MTDERNFPLRKQFQIFTYLAREQLGLNGFRPRNFKINQLQIEIEDFETGSNGYRIVHITDLHLGQWLSVSRLEGVVDLINQQQPDLIVLTGDFVSYEIDHFSTALTSALQNLKASDAKIAVMGNHDYWSGVDKVRNIFRSAEIIELNNRIYEINNNKAKLFVAGIDDVMCGKDRLQDVLDVLPSDVPAFVLVHEPDFADQTAATGRFFLQLSGHSHGGQIALPGGKALIRGPYFLKYVKGMYKIQNMDLYVSNGLGTNTLPFRINCPPEIVVITLKSPKKV